MKSPDCRDIWRRVDAFMLAESLDGQGAYARTQESLLEDAGFFDAVSSEEIVHMRLRILKHKQRTLKSNRSE